MSIKSISKPNFVELSQIKAEIFLWQSKMAWEGVNFFQNQEFVNILECSITFYEYKNCIFDACRQRLHDSGLIFITINIHSLIVFSLSWKLVFRVVVLLLHYGLQLHVTWTKYIEFSNLTYSSASSVRRFRKMQEPSLITKQVNSIGLSVRGNISVSIYELVNFLQMKRSRCLAKHISILMYSQA